MSRVTIDQATQLAIGHHQAGRLAEAEGLYRQVLVQVPDHGDALNLLGALACQTGHFAAAIELIGRAIAIKPAVSDYHSNRAESYRRAGQWAGAIAGFRRAIELEPGRAEFHSNLALALQQSRSGRLDEAIAACHRAIELKPDLAEAHNNLGNALKDQGRIDEAVAAYDRAIGLNPGLAEVHINRGIALTDEGRLDEAITAYDRAIELKPDVAETHNNLGSVLLVKGQLDQAITACRRAIQLKPDYAEAHVNLGNALKDQGRIDEATAAYDRAIELNPDLAEAHLNAAEAYMSNGRLDKAIAAYDQAVRLQPEQAEAHNNLGHALLDRGRIDEAIAACLRAIELKPGLAEAHNNLGNALREAGRHGEAVEACLRAIELKPGLAEAQSNLGNALRDQGRIDEAVNACLRAIELKPDLAEAHNNLGNALLEQGHAAEAIAAYNHTIALRPDLPGVHLNLGKALLAEGSLDQASAASRHALERNPDLAQAHVNLGNVLKAQGRLDEALACFRTAQERNPAYALAASNLAYSVHFHPDYDARAIQAENRRWDAQFALPLARTIQPHSNERAPDRRLRIGYVSPDFRAHPVGRFILPLLESHDHAQYSLFLYSNLRRPDAVTERCRAHADLWRDVFDLSDIQLADTIRQDRIDILVDLSMHMANNRLLVFARKPAPIQVAYLAYCSTTGLGAMDYRLTDPYLDQEGQDERFYSERSLRLPQTYWCYQPMVEAPPASPLPALRTGHITFGCLNNFCKVTAPTLDTWSRLLRAVPEARLLLHAHSGSHRDGVRDFLSRRGVSSERLTFVGSVPAAEYFRIYERIDVALDPFPYGGGTTTCDALWMGVPVVSLAGQTAVGRGGLSILSNIGLPDLVAYDFDQYLSICIDLSANLQRLGELRATLRGRMETSPLMNAPVFARSVEALYRTIWQCWCNNQAAMPPQHPALI